MNVLQTSFKNMICEGRPGYWEESRDFKTIWRDSPGAESEILSVKSDSLSWSVADQSNIDDALDERTEYCCERDVKRHMLKRALAASERRLVQFEVLGDAARFIPSITISSRSRSLEPWRLELTTS